MEQCKTDLNNQYLSAAHNLAPLFDLQIFKSCDDSPHPSLILWGSNLFCYYNHSFAQFLGLENCKGFGQTVRELLCQKAATSLMPLLEQVLETNEPILQREQMVFLNRDGVEKPVYLNFKMEPIKLHVTALGVLFTILGFHA